MKRQCSKSFVLPANHIPQFRVPATIPVDQIPLRIRPYCLWKISFLYGVGPNGKWVPMSRDFTRRFIPWKKQAEVDRVLVALGVIEINHSYVARSSAKFGGDARPKSYRLRATHCDQPAMTAEYRNKILQRKMTEYWVEVEHKKPAPVGIYAALHRWTKTMRIGASDDRLPPADHVALNDVRRGRLRSHKGWCGKSYGTFVDLPGHLRQSVTVGGRVLHGADVRGCAFVSLLALMNELKSGAKFDLWGRGKHLTRAMLEQLRKIVVGDIEDFARDALSGEVYETLAFCQEVENDGNHKSMAMAYLNGGSSFARRPLGKAFESMYPGAAKCVAEIHLVIGGARLARVLASVEVEVMLDGAATDFAKYYPDVPMLTIHDSIWVPEEYVERAKVIAENAWLERTGLVPTVRIERSSSQDPTTGVDDATFRPETDPPKPATTRARAKRRVADVAGAIGRDEQASTSAEHEDDQPASTEAGDDLNDDGRKGLPDAKESDDPEEGDSFAATIARCRKPVGYVWSRRDQCWVVGASSSPSDGRRESQGRA